MRDFINKNRDIILLTIGTLLVILSLCLLFYDRIELLRSNVFAEVEMEKYREGNLNGENKDDEVIDEVDVNTENIEEDSYDNDDGIVTEEDNKKASKENNKIAKEYIGYLEIKNINLKQGLVSKNSFYNNVKYNIQMLSTSDYPDKSLGNVILAGHSGTGWKAFFNDLYRLEVNDTVYVTYKNKKYIYKIVNIYKQPKIGKLAIYRNYDKTTLTLITCTNNDSTTQTIYIAELQSVEE